jgi:hydroxyacylglutathione hydrolase
MFKQMLRRALILSSCMAACGGEQASPSPAVVTSTLDGGTADASAPSIQDTAPGADAGGPNAGSTSSSEAGAPKVDAGAPRGQDAAVGLVPGSLDVSWMHGAANCAESTDPELQVHAYNPTTYIVRQDKCRTFEAPFVYLLLGTDTALLLDTGATNTTTLRDTVTPLVGARALLVAHTHSHGDHVASDGRFMGQPSTTVVGTTVGAVQAAVDIAPWPSDAAELDLGERVLDIVAIPGHEQTHIALYDRDTGLLFTGDTLYPGLLFINDWQTYRASIERLAAFVTSRPVSHVLGAHIEMTSAPGVNYPYGTIFQPDEHVLQLEAAHVIELDAALTELGPTPPAQPVAHDDFVIDPQ